MSDSLVQLDPLNSPHPVPWSWVMAILTATSAELGTQRYYYRTQSLISPDRHYAAYSRLQLQAEPDFFRSRVSSVLFIENLVTGDLQAITPAAPLANNPFIDEALIDRAGTVSMVIPVSWSEQGDRLLAREFESFFGSDIASDYAVIVDQTLNRVHTIAPSQVHYTNAILLGWSQIRPEQVLFQAGMMGEEDWPVWSVDRSGQTRLAETNDQPLFFGQASSSLWTGPQGANVA